MSRIEIWQHTRIDELPAGATFVGADGTLEWVSLEPVTVGQDGTFTLHVRNLVDGGDDFRRWPADAGSRELAVILGAND